MSTYIDPDYKFPYIIEVLDADPKNTKVKFDRVEYQQGDWITADRRYAPWYSIDSIEEEVYTMRTLEYYDSKYIIPGVIFYLVGRTVGEFDTQ